MTPRDSLIERIASDEVLDQAYAWLCQARAHYHHNGDVWHVRFWWADLKRELQTQLRSGQYRLSEYRRVRGVERTSEIWSAMDALVLKAVAIVLGDSLKAQLSLDDRMEELGCCYVRYMDDWVVLAPTRWKLRGAVRAVNEVLAALRVGQHPDKTFVGRIERGFDFLGYRFGPSGMGISRPRSNGSSSVRVGFMSKVRMHSALARTCGGRGNGCWPGLGNSRVTLNRR